MKLQKNEVKKIFFFLYACEKLQQVLGDQMDAELFC